MSVSVLSMRVSVVCVYLFVEMLNSMRLCVRILFLKRVPVSGMVNEKPGRMPALITRGIYATHKFNQLKTYLTATASITKRGNYWCDITLSLHKQMS